MSSDKEKPAAFPACSSWWLLGSVTLGGMAIDRDGWSSEDPQVINWAAWKSSIGFTLGWW